MSLVITSLTFFQRMKEEAERQAQEAAAAAAPTEKDMINDIRENRRRERRQVRFKFFRNIKIFKSISKGTNWGKYIFNGGSLKSFCRKLFVL